MISIIWAVLGMILMGLEAVIPGFVIFFFGLGALITALVTLIPGIGSAYAIQALIWMVSSFASFGFLRKKLAKVFKGQLLEQKTDEYIGRRAVVIEKISPGNPGRIRIEGTSWKADSLNEEIEEGEEVEILEKENLTFIVTKDFLNS
ncbi:MAG: NfeD family protein [Spirochaetales bacterium]|nr:NfeD family protein [Spirochaetales bacterium]